MKQNAGIIREETKWNGLKRILELKKEFYSKDNILKEFKIGDDGEGNGEKNVVLTWEVKSSLVACEAIIRSALMRQESRGVHYRSDFPNRTMKNGWLTSIARRKVEKWYCLNRTLKKSKDLWQICLKNTLSQNIIVNSNE